MKKIALLLLLLLQASILKAGEGTVVGIHGFFSSNHSMLALKRALKCTGLDVYMWDYPSRKFILQCHAQHLVNCLKDIVRYKPGEPIHFAAHSVGAIILRNALNLPDCPYEAKIGRAVLIAPPNRGAALGRKVKNFSLIRWLIGDKSGRQLITFTAEDIQCLGSFPCTMEIMVLAGSRGVHYLDGPNDGFITLEETCLETPACWYQLPLTHGQLLNNNRALCLIKNFIVCGNCPADTAP